MLLLNIRPQFLMHIPEGGQLIWIVVIVVILFGGKKIPELAKGLGKGIREFNDAKEGIKSEIESNIKEKDKIQASATTTPPADTNSRSTTI